MRKTLLLAGTAACVMVGSAAVTVAQAQEYAGARSLPTKAGCPSIEWHVQPPTTIPSPVNGVAFFNDMSGISIIKGTVGADGMIAGTLTSVSGKGPAGTVTGKRAKTATHVELHGDGCSNAVFNLMRFRYSAAASGE